jgi:heme/copper-type cytochrome/quinol oxidase subunit 2
VSQLGRSLVVFGILLALVGVVVLIAGKLGLGRLPGDIVIERKSFRFYFPVVTSIVVSIVLTLLANLFLSRR